MATSYRDRITVDLGGLGPALLARAQAKGLTPSEFVRALVAAELDTPALARAGLPAASAKRVGLRLRMHAEEATRLWQQARDARLAPGAYVAGLCTGATALADGGRPADLAAALARSCSELSTLSRDLRHLTSLLGHGEVAAARQYRERLDGTERDVRAHLVNAAAVLAALRPLCRRWTR